MSSRNLRKNDQQEAALSTKSHVTVCQNPAKQKTSRHCFADKDSFDSQSLDHDQPVAVRTKMERGISRATDNEYLVNQARSKVENDYVAPKKDQPEPLRHSPDSPDSTRSESSLPIPGTIVAGGFIETPVYTFTLPDLTCYEDDFRRFLEKDLIELSSLVSLEHAGRLNWWAEAGICQRLWPLATTGDGNCLLHAASLGMWGFHDRLLTLRKALHAFLSSSESSAAIHRRWRWQCHQQNSQCGLTLSDSEWDDEWRCVLRLASPEPRSSSAMSSSASSNCSTRRRSRMSITACSLSSSPTEEGEVGRSSVGGSSQESGESGSALYESLEEVHVLALAHILRRPIIVVADTILRDMNGEALAPIPFGGIYLPLECPPGDCHKSPLLLTYNAGHFSALVTMQSNNKSLKELLPVVIPVTDSDHGLLTLQFAVDPGPDFRWGQDEFLSENIFRLSLNPSQHLDYLCEYLDLVRVTLPEWVLQPNLEDVPDRALRRKSSIKGSKPMQSVAKHFGTFGKRLKKNISKLGRTANSAHAKAPLPNGKDHENISQPSRKSAVSDKQNYVLAASINTGRVFPYQQEMVTNYLEEARRRYEYERQSRAKLRQEQIEQEERRQREIYLNGGFVDCVNYGCEGQGTSETSYLCKNCFEHQKTLRRNHQQEKQRQQDTRIEICTRNLANEQYYPQPNGHYAKSTFYVSSQNPVALKGAVIPVPYRPQQPANKYHRNDDVFESDNYDEVDGSDIMRVKLPPMTDAVDIQPCRNPSCEFYGSSDFAFFCSKCFSKSNHLKAVAR